MKTISFCMIALGLAFSMISCNQQVKQERLQRIDSLGVHLNYVEEALAEIDSVMLANRVQEIDRTSGWVYDNVTDTLERVSGLHFGDYMRSKKYLNQALTRYDEVRRELAYSEKQIENLRKDVKDNFYSEEEFRGYFQTEAESIANLVEATEELKNKYATSNERYTYLKPKVTRIVDSIKKIIYAPEPIAR